MRLNRFAVSCALLASLSAVSWGGTQNYKIEPGWSHVEFSVKNFGIHTVYGWFQIFSGTINYDDLDVTKSTVTVSIQAASVDTDVKKRDDHLRTADFLDVDKTPEITFHSERIVKSGEVYMMSGLLTIKGHTRPIELPFTYSLDSSSSDGKTVLRAQTQLTINRHDFGLDYGSNFSVGKEVKIVVHIQALHQ